MQSQTRPELQRLISATISGCTGCGRCLKECAFLMKYGTPGYIADTFDAADARSLSRPFECSLCGLCTTLCPERLDLDGLFLEMRREAVDRGLGAYPEHNPLLSYERLGTSRRFTLYRLPEGCATVFFPGCSLSGTRPDGVKRLFFLLQQSDSTLGIIFDCCMKPSHSLGRAGFVSAMFAEMNDWLVRQGVEEVLVACPNCQSMFDTFGRGLKVRTAWEALAEAGRSENPVRCYPPLRKGGQGGFNLGKLKANPPESPIAKGGLCLDSRTITVHDPCVIRNAVPVHRAVRTLVKRQGLNVEEMPHSGGNTVCCGKGGAVDMLNPELAGSWVQLRKKEANGRRIITYCAGCVQALGGQMPTSHLVDLLFAPEQTLAGKKKGAGAPLTYLNRLRLKRSFKRKEGNAVTRERTFVHGEEGAKKSPWKPLIFLALPAAAAAAIHLSGAAQYLQQERLREMIAASGALAPAIYILIYSLAPVLLLPGLPLTIAGGILFGPFWGVVYTITGATIGASLAFLTARYLARDWVKGKLSGPRWEKLDMDVARHGWKVVAFTRLIPAFPFNLLNFAFGLTGIPFLHYALATFIFMLPACIAFIVFSSSILDLIRGNISPASLIGIALIIIVSLLPVIYRRWKKGKREDVVSV
jgi:uncharacterized membrane protein YdjX (TVP38/TMEM64 family)/Fe-S oxidoreductase